MTAPLTRRGAVRNYARHDYDIPISWLTAPYIKVNITSTHTARAQPLLTSRRIETLCHRYSRWTEYLFRQNIPFLTLLPRIRS